MCDKHPAGADISGAHLEDLQLLLCESLLLRPIDAVLSEAVSFFNDELMRRPKPLLGLSPPPPDDEAVPQLLMRSSWSLI